MFKNNKEKENNYISTEEVEKIYGYQKKAFDGKIAEQQSQIDQLTNYISVRFGEDVANSNIATKLNNIEKNLQEIQTSYKTNLEKTTKELKKQIEDESKKIATELNDSQTESYFKLLQKNENDLVKIKKLVDENKENDEKLLKLDGIVKEFIKENELYHQEVQQELKEANQKIGKINYLGISNKFDKKLKEECSKIEDKIEEAKKQTKSEFDKNSESIASIIGSLDERLSEEIAVTSEHLGNTASLVNNLDERLSKEISSVSENVEGKVNSIEEKLSEKLEAVKLKGESTANSVNLLEGNLKKTSESVSSLDKKISKQLENSNKKIEETANSLASLEENLLKEIASANEKIVINKTLVENLDKKLSGENETTNKNIQNVENKLGELNKNLVEKIETISTKIQLAEGKTQDLEENITSKFTIIDEGLQNNQTATNKLEENMQKGFEQAKQEAKDAINKFKESTKEKNAKIEEKIKQVKADIKTVQNETKKMETNWTEKLGGVSNTFNSEIEKAIKNAELESKKIKEELNEQIVNGHNENKTELQNIASTVDIIKNTMDTTYENIGQEISKLKEETKANLEKQENSVTDIEFLKKDYNKYVTKMNNELAKISKALLNAQKKNLETNQNLQVKIKAYIDNKIEKADNTQKVEELINNLDLSIQEREKLQKIEMEEMLNKKLKAIQKENERILNKKIEEISSKFIRENSSYTRTKPNNVTLYEETPKKKNMYELIDENQILKRSAASKKPITTSQEGKSQILKFFYDEEE